MEVYTPDFGMTVVTGMRSTTKLSKKNYISYQIIVPLIGQKIAKRYDET